MNPLMTPIVTAAADMARKQAQGSPVQVDSGWTPTTTMILLAIIVGVVSLLTLYIKMKPSLDTLANERDASLRKDLMTRISALETAMSEKSRDHSDAVAAIKREHAEEIDRVRTEMREQHRACEDENRALRDQIAGLQRMMIAWQVSSGQAAPLSLTPQTRAMVDKLVEAFDLDGTERLSRISEILKDVE